MDRLGTLWSWWRDLRRIWRLVRDPRTPGWLRLLPLLALMYILSPIDLLPDLMIPGIGSLDDLLLLLLVWRLLLDLAPAEKPRTSSGREEIIEATYRVLEE
ncbi:DUF1232 domain-containing protein [Thermoflexus sp.]|uniref:DUF1232 domain-containing protein n=1 Tax=Thermoflexus sp. TaxID=1969742 RepID=UPI001764BCD0|nr:DUF1232 domain-containing protein [Thermoflexus sp.]